tara:strand:- start:61 stop:750 length:690 start_codon:yes stop_codon:yes gene_type:complete
MAGSILAALARVSKGQPKDALVREHLLRNLRAAPDDVELGEGIEFPPWWRALYAHLALTLAERLVAGCDLDPLPQEAVEAARRWVEGSGDEEEVKQAASQVAVLVQSPQGELRSLASALAWTLRLLVALLTRAERPSFSLRSQQVLELALHPGPLLPEELWDLLREAALEWLLRPSATSARRPYNPAHHYTAGDLLLHPTFGPGQVTSVRRDRIDVAFPDQERTLVHKG